MYGINNISNAITSCLQPTKLAGAGELYLVRDLRTRARKEPGDTIANKNLNFVKIKDAKIENFNKELYENRDVFALNRDFNGYKSVRFESKENINKVEFVYFLPTKRLKNQAENALGGRLINIHVDIDLKKAINKQINPYENSNKPTLQRIESDAKKTKEYNYYYSEINSTKSFYCWITEKYYNQLRQSGFNKFYSDYINSEERFYTNYQKKLLKTFYSNPQKFEIYIVSRFDDDYDKIDKETRDSYIGLLQNYIENDAELGKPTIKFEFENNEQLKDFLKENKENLIDSTVEDAEVVEDEPNFKRKSLRGFQDGKPASIFNCAESQLVTKGFSPTYKKLSNYDNLIESANGSDVLVGYGFENTTKDLLQKTVKENYKQVEKLANHLKGDSLIQTCFNIWHWEHCNLKYNYDSAGKEEIRTPARTWKDKNSGVDCDCLAVFTAALLLNLGYYPEFEIVAFNGSDKYAHIFVNLCGVVIDRVLPIFNQRAPLITKTLKMQIPVYSLNGNDKALIALSGLYTSTLSKIFSHTANAEDVINHRKTQLLLNLADRDNNGYKFAVLLMPYVKAIDDSGAFYFDNAKIADIAKKGEAELITLERRNASEAELNGLFKKIGKAFKNAAKSVGNAVKTVAKGAAKATKAVVQSTANVVKSSANLVKAGVQAATGNKKAAKTTLKKAASQIKSAVVDPVKTTVSVTKDTVKATVVDPTKQAIKDTVDITKETIKIAGKIFKVIFIKLNPVAILIRNSLRLLIAVNFLGMATRLNVANMTEAEAAAVGVDSSKYQEAKNAYDRVVRFFVKWGGKKANIEKAIKNGAKKKALFKKDYNKDTKIVESGEDDATLSGTAPIMYGLCGLGEPVTIASALAAVGAFIAKIWNWVKNIVVKVANVAGKIKDKITGGSNSESEGSETIITDTKVTETTTTEKKNNWLAPVLIGGGLLATIALSGGKKRK